MTQDTMFSQPNLGSLGNKFDMTHLFSLPIIRDIALCISLLTRIPVVLPQSLYDRHSIAVWAFPFVGVVWAVFVGAICLVGLWIGLPPQIAAILGLLGGIFLTGGLHEDGLADCADGFWGGWDPARRLDIMKDSHIGTYGVLALIIGLLLRWQAISIILTQPNPWIAIMVAATASRAVLPWIMAKIPNARGAGLSHSVGAVPLQSAIISLAIGGVFILFLLGGATIAIAICAIIVAFAATLLSKIKIGGQTGDTLGATQQVVEIGVLLALTI